MAFEYKLQQVLDELGLESDYQLAQISTVKPQTVKLFLNGEVKRIEMPTLEKLLKTLNKLADEKGIDKTYTIDSLVLYLRD